MRNLVLLFFVFFVTVSAKANGFYSSFDTSKKIIVADIPRKTEPAYFIKESNVVFPDILQNDKDKSINYIETFSNRRRDYLIRTYSRGKKNISQSRKDFKKIQSSHRTENTAGT